MARCVTQEQVGQAADAELRRGDRPTIDKVRAQLGTGSPSTLIRLLHAWWASLSQRLAAQARADLPGRPDAVQTAMQTIWAKSSLVPATPWRQMQRYGVFLVKDEQSLLRPLLDHLQPGDVMLGDAFFATGFLMAEFQQRGVDGVFGQYGARRRSTDFRRVRRSRADFY